MIKSLTVFFPCFNEAGNIGNTVKKALPVLEKYFNSWEMLLIDDGSSDNTGEIIDRICKTDKRVIAIHHSKNRGYGGALKSGFTHAKYPWVAFMDSDGQFDFSQISLFLEAQEQTHADLILGIRQHRADPFIRQVYTLVWSKILPRLIFNLKVTDYSCGFKLIKKEVFDQIQPLVGEEKVTQIEMLVKAQRAGFRFAEVVVKHYPRQSGRQTGADFKVIFKSIYDLLKLWAQLR